MTPSASLWKTPRTLLVLMSIVMPFTFSVWQVLLNNFAIERAAFTGAEIGILQSLREVPGFLAFTAVFILLALKEQTFALLSLLLLSLGVAITGFFPSEYGLYATTVLMSIGFHYFETIKNSLSLQWLSKEEAPAFLGQMISIGSLSALAAFGLIWILIEALQLAYTWLYAFGGGVGLLLVVYMWVAFPRFESKISQHKHLILRKRYWLFYLLTFMSGARRQIFVVFAAFMMVEKFGYSVAQISLLFIINHVLNFLIAPKIGRWIGRIGERRALTIEYSGLFFVFVGYALVENAQIAAALYVIDHVFFAMAIAIKTYFQKIADPADIASSSGVSFTINHIAAVAIPAAFGLIWLINPAAVFYAGAAMALFSLFLSRNIPSAPAPGNEVLVGKLRPLTTDT
ncbi:MAG: MFS transporter [Gammaproteobacteria bacterium]|nr:MFS transporter [Gammaproteobacteria bacterium]